MGVGKFAGRVELKYWSSSSRCWYCRQPSVMGDFKKGMMHHGYIRHYDGYKSTMDGWDCETRSYKRCLGSSTRGKTCLVASTRRRELLACLSSGVGLLMTLEESRVGAVEAEMVVSSVSELSHAIEKAPPGKVIVLAPGR